MTERRHFRIKFPPSERPLVIINGNSFPVIDCSESGMKIKAGQAAWVKIGLAITVKIEFRCGQSHKAPATVVRQLQDLVMINLDKYISTKILALEAERIIANFGEVETTRYVDQNIRKV